MTRVNQGLFSTTMEAEKRDPGNEVEIRRSYQEIERCTCSGKRSLIYDDG